LGINFNDVDLRGAEFYQTDLNYASFVAAHLQGAVFDRSRLNEAVFNEALLHEAKFRDCVLDNAIFQRSDLSESSLIRTALVCSDFRNAGLHSTNLYRSDFSGAVLSGADLSGAYLDEVNLSEAILINTGLEEAQLINCRVYGMSAWDVRLRNTVQRDIIITPVGSYSVSTDNLEVAQFIYLLLKNEKLRAVIDSITSKVVLILGRFTPERKAVLDAIREELRKRDLLPVLFDFEKPSSRNITETVRTLAHLARFVIADITDARSIPQELTAIVPHLPHLPVQPLLLASQEEYGLFKDLRDYPWVLEPVRYTDQAALIAGLDAMVIAPAEAKAKALATGSSNGRFV
jgi:uncharacterized protein YjbI with pentapeptide repeats